VVVVAAAAAAVEAINSSARFFQATARRRSGFLFLARACRRSFNVQWRMVLQPSSIISAIFFLPNGGVTAKFSARIQQC
jgi:hypothetical protein